MLEGKNILITGGTVAEKIALGKIDALTEEVEAATRAAQLGVKAVRLFGGQKHHLSITHAFIRNASIHLLESATAVLGSHTVTEVKGAIDELSENRTVFCVAHRLATLRVCDRIFLLKHSRIIEDSTFLELLLSDKKFASTTRSQDMSGDSL
jgi:ABC-type multidrug transport system fused ATPase/permease subunit